MICVTESNNFPKLNTRVEVTHHTDTINYETNYSNGYELGDGPNYENREDYTICLRAKREKQERANKANEFFKGNGCLCLSELRGSKSFGEW